MPKRFILDIATDPKASQATFRLLDAKTDALLAAHEVRIDNTKAFDWEGIFDTQTISTAIKMFYAQLPTPRPTPKRSYC